MDHRNLCSDELWSWKIAPSTVRVYIIGKKIKNKKSGYVPLSGASKIGSTQSNSSLTRLKTPLFVISRAANTCNSDLCMQFVGFATKIITKKIQKKQPFFLVEIFCYQISNSKWSWFAKKPIMGEVDFFQFSKYMSASVLWPFSERLHSLEVLWDTAHW